MSEPASSDFPRRNLLRTRPSPGQRLDYVITLGCDLALASHSGVTLKMRYIPDRLILDQTAIADYVQAIEKSDWAGLEELAQSLLDDISNELVPRWLEISLRQATSAVDYAVTMEDRQPGWANPQLLGRIRPWEHV